MAEAGTWYVSYCTEMTSLGNIWSRLLMLNACASGLNALR